MRKRRNDGYEEEKLEEERKEFKERRKESGKR